MKHLRRQTQFSEIPRVHFYDRPFFGTVYYSRCSGSTTPAAYGSADDRGSAGAAGSSASDNPKMDQYEPSQVSTDVTVGMWASFAFYEDKMTDRRLPVNTELNNDFDSPLDQPPDNYVRGDKLIGAPP